MYPSYCSSRWQGVATTRSHWIQRLGRLCRTFFGSQFYVLVIYMFHIYPHLLYIYIYIFSYYTIIMTITKTIYRYTCNSFRFFPLLQCLHDKAALFSAKSPRRRALIVLCCSCAAMERCPRADGMRRLTIGISSSFFGQLNWSNSSQIRTEI